MKPLKAALVFAALIFLPHRAPAQCLAPFEQGSWHNIDPATRGIARIDVTFTCNDMRLLERASIITLVIATIGCQQRSQDTGTRMGLDSAASGKNVTIVRPKEALRPDEAITDLQGLQTTMQYDIDAMKRIPSREVVYVKPSEAMRPAERKQ